MAVSFRTVGTWAELTADGTVAIPATPQAGDRMYLLARWKDFSVTATVANWTEITEFADGAVGMGNGTGSVKVACWYRDWQSGDSNPTIDFSASPDNASVVIIVMQKAADDVWTTPLFVTAAMTNWTTTSQIVSASSTVAVPSGGVVMGLIGIRDDTATMTRPTTGIDDSAGAVTWNGDYVEAPATHHSTTTGFDGAADLGYRLVSIGATATLRMTGTISAAETGAALWVVQGVNTVVIPSQSALSVTTFAPTFGGGVVPASVSLTISGFAPLLRSSIVPASLSLVISSPVPVAGFGVIPGTASLTILVLAPSVRSGVVPSPSNLTITSFPSPLALTTTPPVISLTISPFGLSLVDIIVPLSQSLNLVLFSPLLTLGVTPNSLSLSLTRLPPSVLPFDIIWLDPGGDAVQAAGYFNIDTEATGLITFDTSQKVAGVGSWKFDSGDGTESEITAAVRGVLGPTRRFSTYWRYDSVPDKVETLIEFTDIGEIYSGGGFTDGENLSVDDGNYATGSPAQNSGQGIVLGFFGLVSSGGSGIPVNAVIDSVKIIYERKYDVDTSIGISRVKWRVDGVEGPDHDNLNQPLADTVVEVDVTGDRAWERQYLRDTRFEVIAEARRGDTATAHTQSWDYVKVEVQYHLANTILSALSSPSQDTGFQIAVSPKGDGVVLRFIEGINIIDETGGAAYDGITELLPDVWYRISFACVHHGADNLDIKLYVNSIQELSIAGANTNLLDAGQLVDLHYGWLISPGVDHLCWFDQLYIDDGDDLSDPGNVLMTAKLPATVSDDEWTTTGGTGAVNERPLSETNYRQQQAFFGSARQTYTLQTAATGDIDVSGETVVGQMAWAWANVDIGVGDSSNVRLVIDGVDRTFGTGVAGVLGAAPSLLRYPATTSVYPASSDGIGVALVNVEDLTRIGLFECGIVVAYEGPSEDDSLLPFQLLAEDSTTNVSDTMDDDPPASYVLQSEVAEASDVIVTTVLSSSSAEGETPQQQAIIESRGGGDSGIVTVNPGIELSASVDVSGAGTSVGLRRVDELIV